MYILNNLLNLQSPLEQFEVSSYGTTLFYNVTNSVDLINETLLFSFNKYSFYNLFDLLFIYVILKSIEFIIKQEGFIFLFIFSTVIYTCFNLFSFTDFAVYEGAFQYYTKGLSDPVINSINSYLKKDSLITTHHYFTLIDWLNAFPIIISEHKDLIQYNTNIKNITTLEKSFYLESFIPNIILNANLLVGYAWFLGYIFYTGFKNTQDENVSSICLESLNKINKFSSKWISGENINWFLLFEDKDFLYFKNIFLPKYIDHIDAIKNVIRHDDNTNIVRFTEDGFSLGSTLFGWVIILLVLVGIFLASNPQMLGLNQIDNVKINLLLENEFKNLKLTDPNLCLNNNCNKPSSTNILSFVENELPTNIINNIFNQLINISYKIYPELFTMEFLTIRHIIQSIFPFLLDSSLNKTTLDLNYFLNAKDNVELFVENNSDNFLFVTFNTSFINIYSVIFCFIFIFLIIYLLFNKSLSFNTNYIIPNIYQTIGENIYKISLNLFYSILGKHLTHPEFFIKINTIFLFLVISNVQGMIPYMSTLTSALTNTFFIALALFISIITTLLDKKGLNYFLNLFMPSGCPIFLVLLLIPIEVISYSFRVISISVRLFANMMAGHTLLKVIVGFSWIIVFLGNTSLINLFPIVILFILTLLEFGVAFIQAYIFTILSCMYIRDIFTGH